ncbi:MAG: hypothetical protein K6G60_08710 [Lachnospiraceae bacterium]|nr:hypothetical protein [Lachnospiraceae bacterium]
MKKILQLFFIVSSVFILSACGKTSINNESDPKGNTDNGSVLQDEEGTPSTIVQEGITSNSSVIQEERTLEEMVGELYSSLTGPVQPVEDYDGGFDDNGFIAGIDEEEYIKWKIDPTGELIMQIDYDELVEEQLQAILAEGEISREEYDSISDEKKEALKEELKENNQDWIILRQKKMWAMLFVPSNYVLIKVPEEHVLSYAGFLKNAAMTGQGLGMFYGSANITDFNKYYYKKMSEEEYDKYILEEALKYVGENLAYQMIYKKCNLEEYFSGRSTLGKGEMTPAYKNALIKEDVYDYLYEKVVVEE